MAKKSLARPTTPPSPRAPSPPPPSPARSAASNHGASAGSASAPPASAGSHSVPPDSGGNSAPDSAAYSFVPSASFLQVPFDDIKPGMVVQTSGCRFSAELVNVLGLSENDHISDKAPQSDKHWVLVIDTITDHKHSRKKVLLCANITTLNGAASLQESSIPAAWREYFIPIDPNGDASEGALVPFDGWPGVAPCWVISVMSVQLMNRTDSFAVVEGSVKIDEDSVRKVRDVMFHNEKSGLSAALLDPENEIHKMKDIEATSQAEETAEQAEETAEDAERDGHPDPSVKANLSFDDIKPGMIARAQHARFSVELAQELGIALDDPICKAQPDDKEHEEKTHEVLVLSKGRDAPTGKQVVIGLNLTRLGGVKSIEESSVPEHWRKYFIRVDPEGKPDDGDLVPIGGWLDGPCWAITVKTAEIITSEGNKYKILQGAIPKFDEHVTQELFDKVIEHEKDRVAAAMIDPNSWLRSHLDTTPVAEPEAEAEAEQPIESEPGSPPATGGSEASELSPAPRRKVKVRQSTVSVVLSESEAEHEE